MSNTKNKPREYFTSNETLKIIDELLENKVFQNHMQNLINKFNKTEIQEAMKLKRNEIKKFAKKIGIASDRSKSLTIKLKNIANLCTKRKKSKKLFESAWQLISLKNKLYFQDFKFKNELLKQIEKRKHQILFW